MARIRGRPRVAFLPSGRTEQATLLRSFNVARGLSERGWGTLFVPMQLDRRQRDRVLRKFAPDLVVLQTCRHPLNRVEYLSDYPFVLDLDDADFLDPRLQGAMVDVARAAAGVIGGSRFIRDWAAAYCDNTAVIWTGAPVQAAPRKAQRDRGRLVTWAQATPLLYPAEFRFVADTLTAAARLTGPFTFRLYGWPPGEDHPILSEIGAAGIAIERKGRLDYDAFVHSLEDAAVGLSPVIVEAPYSRGKSFGKILAYLDARVPVLCSDRVDHGLFFTPETGIVSNDPETWAREIAALLDDPDRRAAMAARAHADYRERLSVAPMVDLYAGFLRQTLARQETVSASR